MRTQSTIYNGNRTEWSPIQSVIIRMITTVFVDTQLWKTQHPRKRLQNFRQSCVLLTDRIEIHQLQPLVWPSNLLFVMRSGCDWWISIRSVNNTQDWQKCWKRFRRCFVFQSRVSTKTVVTVSYNCKSSSEKELLNMESSWRNGCKYISKQSPETKPPQLLKSVFWIDLFRLYILFSHYRSCGDTQEIWSFVLFVKKRIFMLACTLFNEQDKGSNLLSIITWSVLGKQNVQAKKVYWLL